MKKYLDYLKKNGHCGAIKFVNGSGNTYYLSSIINHKENNFNKVNITLIDFI